MFEVTLKYNDGSSNILEPMESCYTIYPTEVPWSSNFNVTVSLSDEVLENEISMSTIVEIATEFPEPILENGGNFNNHIPDEATEIIFTDIKVPEDKVSVDVSEQQNKSVLAWMDDTTWYVSSRQEGRAVIANNCNGMFRDNANLVDIDFNMLDTSNVTGMKAMFYNCSGLTSLNLSKFDTANVTDMSSMFRLCNNLNSIDMSGFDTSNVTSMFYMFHGCSKLISLNLSSFNTYNVTNMNSMFFGCGKLVDLYFGNKFNTLKVTNMSQMFRGCSKLNLLDVSTFDTSSVIYMNMMFNACSSLELLDLSSFDTSNVINMAGMFQNCNSMIYLKLGDKFDTLKVTNMSGMFSSCNNMSSVDLSGLNTSSVVNADTMFYNCKSLNTQITIRGNVSSYSDMFTGAASKTGSQIKVNYIADTYEFVKTLVESATGNIVMGEEKE